MTPNEPYFQSTPAAPSQPGVVRYSPRPGRKLRVSAAAARGASVTNYDNEELGTIEDFMFDMSTGRLGYALLRPRGAAGEARLLPVPLRALTVEDCGEYFLLNVDKSVLKFAPAFERKEWPDTAEPRWRSGIESFYSF